MAWFGGAKQALLTVAGEAGGFDGCWMQKAVGLETVIAGTVW